MDRHKHSKLQIYKDLCLVVWSFHLRVANPRPTKLLILSKSKLIAQRLSIKVQVKTIHFNIYLTKQGLSADETLHSLFKNWKLCNEGWKSTETFVMITKVFISQLVQSLFGIYGFVWICLFVCQHKQGNRGKEKGVTTYI
jgi:hypothetical protein